ncbi:MAG: peptidase S10, partial [Phycicoccus sp.]
MGETRDESSRDRGPARRSSAGAATANPPGAETTDPAPPSDDLVTTHHTLAVGRRRIRYTATTGRVVLREEVYDDGVFTGHRAKAEMSMTSYVADAPAGARRPVTFAFNGGPGSSSVW